MPAFVAPLFLTLALSATAEAPVTLRWKVPDQGQVVLSFTQQLKNPKTARMRSVPVGKPKDAADMPIIGSARSYLVLSKQGKELLLRFLPETLSWHSRGSPSSASIIKALEARLGHEAYRTTLSEWGRPTGSNLGNDQRTTIQKLLSLPSEPVRPGATFMRMLSLVELRTDANERLEPGRHVDEGKLAALERDERGRRVAVLAVKNSDEAQVVGPGYSQRAMSTVEGELRFLVDEGQLVSARYTQDYLYDGPFSQELTYEYRLEPVAELPPSLTHAR